MDQECCPWGHWEYKLEILRLLAKGEKEIEAGVGFELGAVLSEADKLLD